jgi:hypothetical protein
MANPATALIQRFLGRLQRPMLFKLAAGLFLLSFFLPDPIPFLDEILFAIVTLLLSRQKAIDVSSAPPQEPDTGSSGSGR